MGTYAIGDSHSTFFDQAGIMKSHWTGPLHVATIYQLLKKGLNLYTIMEDLAKSDHFVNIGVFKWQCPNGVYDIPNIKSGDCILFCFGFNDIQKNIYKYAKDNYKDEIYRLINEYLLFLKKYECELNIKCIPCSIPPNPSPSDPGASGIFEFGLNGDFSTTGSSNERNIYTKYANKIIKELSKKYELAFFDIYDEISDSKGFLKKDYSSDYIHLDCYKNQYIVDRIKYLVKEIINNNEN